MKNFKFHSAFLTFGLIAGTVGTASAAPINDVLVSIEGAKTGRFAGESLVKGAQNKLVASSLTYEIKSPRDVASGMATGKRQHGPICIKKGIGAASPQIFNALVTNESLKSVVFEFQRTNAADGRMEIYYTIKLSDAVISSYRIVKESSPTAKDTDVEEVCFAFQRIEMRSEAAKTTAVDDIQGGPAAVRRK